MTGDDDEATDAQRLERLWASQFGDDYVDRNTSFDHRATFWAARMAAMPCERVLEVGCNIGGNLEWIASARPHGNVTGVDINEKALSILTRRVRGVHAVRSSARELPFASRRFDLVFTMGVLIHQPDESLHHVMAEMVRCTDRWLFCGEYHAAEAVDVPYRGVEGALFKRDYGRLFTETFPELRLSDQGFLGRDSGWDDVTWWVLERRTGDGSRRS